MTRFLAKVVTTYPVLVIVLILALVAALGSGVRKVEIDENIKEMLPRDIESRLVLNELEDIYGGSDMFLIAFHHEESVFNPTTLNKLLAVTDTVEAIHGVTRVTSLATTNQILGTEWGMEVIPFLEEEVWDMEEAQEIGKRIVSDSLYLGQLVSEDLKWTTIIAVLDTDANTNGVFDEIKELTAPMEGPEEIILTGLPVIQGSISKNISGDLRKLIPLVISIIVIILFISFRTWTGVVLPILVAIMSMISMVGLMGHLGTPFMVINNVMPAILIAVGISYAIHILVGFYEEVSRGTEKKEALTITILHIGTPVILAGVTTIVGFGTMLTAPLPVYADFGAYLAFGVFMATLITITLIPSLLVLLPVPKHIANKSKLSILDKFLEKISRFVPTHRKTIIITSLIFLVLLGLGFLQLEMDMNPITFFSKNSSVRVADHLVNENLGGSMNLNVLFEGDAQNREVMTAMEELQDYIESFDETGSSFSLATVVKRINRSLHEDNPEMEILPDTDVGIAQALLMYSMSSSPEDFEAFVDNNYENAQVVARLKSVSTKRMAVMANSVNDYLEENFSHLGEIKATGFLVFMKDLAELIITSQMRSLGMSILIIWLIAWITYRSFRLGMFAIIPVAMTVIVNFGMMGLLGITLSIPTAVISNVIIGIGVDFSLHFLSRFKLELKKADHLETVVSNTIKHVGKPIMLDALPTALGFLVLLASGFIPIRFVGILISLTMMLCAFAALTILASAVLYYKKNTSGSLS
jgi:predicted RND superfamily exporter protein